MSLYAGVSRTGAVFSALLLAFLLYVPHRLAAQSEVGTPAVRLFGTSRISTQYADVRGAYQGLPAKFARWEFDPSIALWGIPFSSHLFLSSERDRFGESINTFNFNFSIRSSDLQEYIRRRVEDRIESLRSAASAEAAADTTVSDIQNTADSLQQDAARIDEARQQVEEKRAKAESEIAQLEDLRNIRDSKLPEQAKKLEQLGVISGTEQFLLNFPYIGIGMNHPNYSPLTLSGLAVNGLDMEFNPGKFYLAFSYGTSEKPVQAPAIVLPTTPVDSLLNPDSLVNRTYDRKVIAGRIGYGRKGGDHVFFTMLHARDDANAMAFDTNNVILTPKENLLLGLDLRILGFDENLSLDGEIVGSVLTENTHNAPLDNDDIPSFLTDLIEPKMSTHVDYAYALKLQYAIPETYTRMSGSVRMIGPGFSSLGVPYLRSDLFRYEARIDQGFLRRQITVGGFYRHERDNLIPWKRSTTTLDGYGVNLGLNFRDYPYLQLLVSPYTQRNNSQDSAFKLNNRTLLISAATGYSYRIGTLLGTTNLTYGLQTSNTERALSDFRSNTYSLNQSVGFEFPLLLAAGVGLTEQKYSTLNNSITFVDASASYTFADSWTATAGATLMSEESGERTGYYVGTSMPLWELGTLDVRAERNAFNNKAVLYLDAPPDEFILRATLSTSW